MVMPKASHDEDRPLLLLVCEIRGAGEGADVAPITNAKEAQRGSDGFLGTGPFLTDALHQRAPLRAGR